MEATASRQTLFDTLRRTAARHPHKTAIQQGELSWTYSEFRDLCRRLAGGVAGLGIEPGDRVAILSRNSAAFAATRYALAAVGAVLVPVNFMLKVEEAAYVLNHSGARVLFVGNTEADKAVALREHCSGLEHLVWLGDQSMSPHGMLSFTELVAAEPYLGEPPNDNLCPAQIIYTSGTESAPKGAVLSHSAVLWQYGSCIADAEIAHGDVWLHSMPLYHCAQLDCFLGPSIQMGGTNIITDDPSPDNLLRLLESEGISSFFAPPTVWIALLNSPRFGQTDLSALQKGYYGASIMPVEIMRRLQSSLPRIRLWNLYGQTEIAPTATILKPEDQLRKPGSAGKPVLHVETRVVDDTMNDVAVGEVGEVVHRSPQLLSCYYNDPERTAAAFEGGWFHSGDLATIDAEGYITIVDRKKDMIKTGGENVSGREVEEAIYQLEGVAETAVVGLAHPRWIEAVVAVVVLQPGATLTERDIIDHCTKRLAGFKVPKRVVFTETLPRNPSGKILKRDLRNAYQAVFADAAT
ncbi:MAG: long-chain-fatty-acid--CoA ligase [Pseudomonadales bacterium]|nr:long-chain-fatty-acid--CoA ligase [Pseudomonadales bacterium]MCP5190268.1 long-chain-fatty-acid--CoA ligase [Pseudomonadales bacterium]